MSHLEGKNTHQNDLFLGCLKGLSASCPLINSDPIHKADNCLGCQGLTKMSQKFWRGVIASAPYCGCELKVCKVPRCCDWKSRQWAGDRTHRARYPEFPKAVLSLKGNFCWEKLFVPLSLYQFLWTGILIVSFWWLNMCEFWKFLIWPEVEFFWAWCAIFAVGHSDMWPNPFPGWEKTTDLPFIRP